MLEGPGVTGLSFFSELRAQKDGNMILEMQEKLARNSCSICNQLDKSDRRLVSILR